MRMSRLRHLSKRRKPFNGPFHTNWLSMLWRWEGYPKYYSRRTARGTAQPKRILSKIEFVTMLIYVVTRGRREVGIPVDRMDKRGSIPGLVKDFSLVPIELFPIGAGVISPEIQRQGCEADESPSFSVQVKNASNCIPGTQLNRQIYPSFLCL